MAQRMGKGWRPEREMHITRVPGELAYSVHVLALAEGKTVRELIIETLWDMLMRRQAEGFDVTLPPAGCDPPSRR